MAIITRKDEIQNQEAEATEQIPAPSNVTNIPTQKVKKEWAIVRFAKKCGRGIKRGYTAVKENPVLTAVANLVGIGVGAAAGSYITYRIVGNRTTSEDGPAEIPTYEPIEIPDDGEDYTETEPVEYVDAPMPEEQE